MSKNKSDTVSLTVGDGGAATLRFIKEQVLPRFGNPILNRLEDAAHVSLPRKHLAVTTDSYVVDPPIFPGGNIGWLAITGTINDLVASGARPIYLTLSLIVAEGFPYSDLEEILDAAEEAARQSQVTLVAGDTKVLDRQSYSGIIINTTGLGIPVKPGRDYALANAQAGDQILITGTIGDHGLAILSFREGLGFEHRVQSDCAALDELILPLLDRFNTIHCMRDPTRGGVLNALVDLAEASATRVILEAESLPIQPEVQMGCEMLGLEPLSMLNEGKMLLVVGPSKSEQVLAELKQHPLGTNSTIIGEIVASDSARGELVLRENGLLKVRIRPEGDAIPRLC